MAQGATEVSELLFDAFRHGDAGVQASIDELTEPEASVLVGELGKRAGAQDPEAAAAFCRMLLGAARTREDAIGRCVALIQDGIMRDRLAFATLPELRAAIMDLCAAREAVERSSSLTFLERICNSLVSFLEQDSPPPAEFTEPRQAAIAQALELLPTCLECALNAELFIRGGRASRRAAAPPAADPSPSAAADPAAAPRPTRGLRRDIVKRILAASWPPAMTLPLLTTLIDLDLDAAEQSLACERLCPPPPPEDASTSEGNDGPAAGSARQAPAPPEAHLVGLIQASSIAI
ncbi:hypothetical protein T484DRAFT_1779885 [Baffinella frigidus]|nr:hypothetical protein T484DRAFT_1779885 [Cryptophyta sp. CCMP2293]